MLEEVLDGVAAGLGLPAEEGASVVGDGEFESHGSCCIQRFRISMAAAWSMMDFCCRAFFPAWWSFSAASSVVYDSSMKVMGMSGKVCLRMFANFLTRMAEDPSEPSRRMGRPMMMDLILRWEMIWEMRGMGSEVGMVSTGWARMPKSSVAAMPILAFP